MWCSKMFEIEFDRSNQNQFSVFMGQNDLADEQVKESQLFIDNNFSTRITVGNLTEMISISRRNLVRRFKKATTTSS
jgi:transcriptional regulator GlxA family with amidase domain